MDITTEWNHKPMPEQMKNILDDAQSQVFYQ